MRIEFPPCFPLTGREVVRFVTVYTPAWSFEDAVCSLAVAAHARCFLLRVAPPSPAADMLMERPLRVLIDDESSDWITLDSNRAFKLQRCALQRAISMRVSALPPRPAAPILAITCGTRPAFFRTFPGRPLKRLTWCLPLTKHGQVPTRGNRSERTDRAIASGAGQNHSRIAACHPHGYPWCGAVGLSR